jgi:hypothetical protein
MREIGEADNLFSSLGRSFYICLTIFVRIAVYRALLIIDNLHMCQCILESLEN